MVETPNPTLVTRPVDETVATDVLLLDHVPPIGPPVNVIVPPRQVLLPPEIYAVPLTVTVRVAKQPPI